MIGYINLTHTNNGKIEKAKQELKQYVDGHTGTIVSISVNGVQQEIDADKNVNIEVPTKTSDITNDSGFVDNTVNNLANYYLKSQTYTQSEVNALLAAIKTIKAEIVAELPTASAETYFNESKTIYMVRNTATGGSDYYNEYITIRSGNEGEYTYSWEFIGNTQIDLTNYVQKTTTIAGVDLQDNITKAELLIALNVEDGAQVNVQSDWGQNDNTADDYIKNKPSIDNTPTANSTNLVTSGGVYSFVNNAIASAITTALNTPV